LLSFDGVYRNCEVVINGQLVTSHPYGYTAFQADLTDHLWFDRPNRLEVTVNNSAEPNSRWYSGSGIYRSVELLTAPPLHIAPWGIFARTDRDINLQRVMNCLVFGPETGLRDWIPDRAIGPTDDALYEAEQAYSDGDLERLTGKTPEEIQAMTTTEKRETLLALRKEELRKLIRIYYDQRGWSEQGVPTVETLQSLGLWTFLTEEARTRIAALQ
jgi:hypothetical protein